MEPQNHAASDLEYVRRVLERDAHPPIPSSIAVLWAILCFVGFLCNDLRPAMSGVYWSIAGPLGFLVSTLLGYRHARRHGHRNTALGRRWAQHFGVLLIGMMVAGVAAGLGAFDTQQVGLIALLLVGVCYLLAGVHLSRLLLPVGVLLLLGVPIVLTLARWQWTVVGSLVAVSLLATAWIAGRQQNASV